MYGLYTGGFVAFIVFLAILEQMGVPKQDSRLFLRVLHPSRSTPSSASRRARPKLSEYYVAGRRVPAFYNGMATGADWMSAASFVGMAGSLFLLGYDGIAWVLGWTGGFVLVSILVGPYLRKFGAYTVPDFLSFDTAATLRASWAWFVLVCCSLHLCDGADLRHRPDRLALSRHAVRNRGVRRPRRHLVVRDAGRYEGGDLDQIAPVHRADRRLPHADRNPIDAALWHSNSRADLRQGHSGYHGPRAAIV